MLMERRVKGNLHARCGPGEKPETASKAYLSVSGAKSQGMKQLMAGAGVAVVGAVLIPKIKDVFG